MDVVDVGVAEIGTPEQPFRRQSDAMVCRGGTERPQRRILTSLKTGEPTPEMPPFADGEVRPYIPTCDVKAAQDDRSEFGER